MAIKHCIENLAEVIEDRKNKPLTATGLKIKEAIRQRDELLAAIEAYKASAPQTLAAELPKVRAEKELIKEQIAKAKALQQKEAPVFTAPAGMDSVLASILRFQAEQMQS